MKSPEVSQTPEISKVSESTASKTPKISRSSKGHKTEPHPDNSVLLAQPLPPIVLIHGLRGAPAGLQEVADLLRASGYSVFTPSVPPFAGASPLKAYTTDAYLDYLKNYLSKNNFSHPILIGHSMGSIIVAAFAKKYPDLIDDRVILLSPISQKTNPVLALISPLSALFPRHLVDYITTKYLFIPKDHDLFQKSLTLTHECSDNCPPRPKDVITAARYAATHSVAEFLLLNQKKQDSKSLPQNPNPTHKNSNLSQKAQKFLFIAGAKDRIVKQSATEQLATDINATLYFIPNSGHLHNYENPQATAKHVLNFLKNN